MSKPKLAIVRRTPSPLANLTREEKLIRAKQFLGTKWVLHPNFDAKNLNRGLLDDWKSKLVRYRP
jgi:hypothetical protein